MKKSYGTFGDIMAKHLETYFQKDWLRMQEKGTLEEYLQFKQEDVSRGIREHMERAYERDDLPTDPMERVRWLNMEQAMTESRIIQERIFDPWTPGLEDEEAGDEEDDDPDVKIQRWWDAQWGPVVFREEDEDDDDL